MERTEAEQVLLCREVARVLTLEESLHLGPCPCELGRQVAWRAATPPPERSDIVRPSGLGRRFLSRHDAIMGARSQRRSRHGHGSTCSCLALVGWSATAGTSRQPDRQGWSVSLRQASSSDGTTSPLALTSWWSWSSPQASCSSRRRTDRTSPAMTRPWPSPSRPPCLAGHP